MDQSAYTRKIRDTTRARGPRGPQASPYRDATGSFMASVAGGAAYVGCTNCYANTPVVPTTTVPDAPTDVSGVLGDAQVTVAFVPPTNDGGSPILYYTVLTTSDASGETIPDVSGVASPIAVTGLTNGTPYTFRVTATNSVGPSAPSAASDPVTPLAPAVLRTVTFTSSDTWTAPADVSNVEYLIVGGGGGSGGGFDTGGGGGGGGGMVIAGTVGVSPGAYPITVGAGGTAGTSIRSPVSETPGGAGENSTFNGLVALGGDGGYASRANAGVSSAGGDAAVPPSTAATGGSGGGSAGDGNGAGGGGGGSSGNGASGVANTGGTGGAGTSSSITGAPVTYGVGGRGSNGNQNYVAVAGTANTGNGASGGGATSSADENGAVGGSGVVVLQYMSAYAP